MNILSILNTLIVVFILASYIEAQQNMNTYDKNLMQVCYKFDFGHGKVREGYVQVLPDMQYNAERGFGFCDDPDISSIDRGSDDALMSDFITGVKPFIFAVNVPEGNYNITVISGDLENESKTTIKAESRRLMIEELHTGEGEFKKRMFTTNVRYASINENEEVKLKPREKDHPDWDRRLTIEFNNMHPCICAMEIVRLEDIITVYLAGNSTVTDQQYEPWASWGQMLPRFFKPGKVSVANHAESGEALKSFIAEKRLKKILSNIKEGDYLFIQFAHNDQKPQNSAYVKPFTGYKEHLRLYIREARERKAIPVLITPMHRRNFNDNGEIINTHGDYPEAMRQTAREEDVPLIDLNEMSRILFETLGIEGSKKAFVHYSSGTFPGQAKELKDNSHFSNYGAYQLAKCIVEGIKLNELGIAEYLSDDIDSFDPANPDPFENWSLPLSPVFEME